LSQWLKDLKPGTERRSTGSWWCSDSEHAVC